MVYPSAVGLPRCGSWLAWRFCRLLCVLAAPTDASVVRRVAARPVGSSPSGGTPSGGGRHPASPLVAGSSFGFQLSRPCSRGCRCSCTPLRTNSVVAVTVTTVEGQERPSWGPSRLRARGHRGSSSGQGSLGEVLLVRRSLGTQERVGAFDGSVTFVVRWIEGGSLLDKGSGAKYDAMVAYPSLAIYGK